MKVGGNLEKTGEEEGCETQTRTETNKKVATKLCNAFFPISLNVLSANLHPTEEPRINKQ